MASGQEPKADGNLSRVEELPWQRHDAIDNVALNECSADLTDFAGRTTVRVKRQLPGAPASLWVSPSGSLMITVTRVYEWCSVLVGGLSSLHQ